MVRRNDKEVFRRQFDFGRKSSGGLVEGTIEVPSGPANFKAWAIPTDRSFNGYEAVDLVVPGGETRTLVLELNAAKQARRHAPLASFSFWSPSSPRSRGGDGLSPRRPGRAPFGAGSGPLLESRDGRFRRARGLAAPAPRSSRPEGTRWTPRSRRRSPSPWSTRRRGTSPEAGSSSRGRRTARSRRSTSARRRPRARAATCSSGRRPARAEGVHRPRRSPSRPPARSGATPRRTVASGRLPWEEVVAPAERLAREGFRVPAGLSERPRRGAQAPLPVGGDAAALLPGRRAARAPGRSSGSPSSPRRSRGSRRRGRRHSTGARSPRASSRS